MKRARLKKNNSPFTRMFMVLALLSFCCVSCVTVPRISKIDPPSPSPEKSAYSGKDIYLTRFALIGLTEKDKEQDAEQLRQQFITYLLERGKYGKVIDATSNREKVPQSADVLTLEVGIAITLVDKFNYSFWPALSRSGVATIEGAAHLFDGNGNMLGEKKWKREEPFSYTFYGWYRTQPIRDVFKVAFQDVFNNISILAPVKYARKSSSREISPAVQSDVDEIAPGLAKANRGKKAFAVVIGIEQYRLQLPPADYAAHDAQIVAEYLTKVLGYAEENVVTLTNDSALKSDLEKYFERWLSNHVEKGGTVFVYFSGHGAPNPKSGDAYLVPYDGDPSFIEQTGYSLNRMYEQLGKLPAKEIIVALDSCFSGAGGRSVLAKGARPLVMNVQNTFALSHNAIVLSAAKADQISSTYDEKGHGLFTYFLLKGIKNEDIVRPDGSLAIKDLFNYIKPQVESTARKKYNNEQTPQLIEGKR